MKTYDVIVNGGRVEAACGRSERESVFLAREIKAEFPAAYVSVVGHGKNLVIGYKARTDYGRSAA